VTRRAGFQQAVKYHCVYFFVFMAMSQPVGPGAGAGIQDALFCNNAGHTIASGGQGMRAFFPGFFHGSLDHFHNHGPIGFDSFMVGNAAIHCRLFVGIHFSPLAKGNKGFSSSTTPKRFANRSRRVVSTG
jgi:hypothetical protein